MIRSKTTYIYLPGICLWVILFFAFHFLSLTILQKTLLLALTLLSGYGCKKAVTTGLLQLLDRTSWIFLALITGYAGFSCVGDKVILQHASFLKLVFYVLFTVWLFPIGIAFLYLTASLRKKLPERSGQQPLPAGSSQGIKLWFLLFSIPFAVGCVYLCAFFPGIMSNDSLSQWGQAIGQNDLNDWHPVFHTFFNRFFITLYRSPASIAIAQILFLSAVIAGFGVFLYRQGIPKKWLVIFITLLSLLPQLGIYSVTLWKDIPFTTSLLWLTLVLGRIVTDPQFLRKPSGGLQLTVSLVAVALFRHNGLIPYFLIVAALSFYCYKRKAAAGSVYLAFSVALIAGYNYFILNRKDVIPIPKAIKLEAPVHGIAAVLADEIPLPPQVDKKMEYILPKDTWLKFYSPYSAEDYQFKTDGIFIDRLSQFSIAEVLGMYGATFTRHPYILVKARLNGVDFIWDLTQPESAFNLRYNTELEANEFGLVQNGNNKLRNILKQYLKLSEDVNSIFIWRVAIYTILLLLSLLLVRIEKRGIKEFFLIFSPLITCILSLLPSMILQEYRYVCFIYFLFGFLWLLVLSNAKAAR